MIKVGESGLVCGEYTAQLFWDIVLGRTGQPAEGGFSVRVHCTVLTEHAKELRWSIGSVCSKEWQL